MLNLNNVLFLAVIYTVAYGLGLLISKLWWWLRILAILLFLANYFGHFAFDEVNLRVFLILIVPACLLVYPSLVKMIAPNLVLNPFYWIYYKIQERKYLKRREQEEKQGQENIERIERIVRMQTEEAERQRQFEREKAEWDAKKRAEEQANRESGQREKSKADTKRNPYEVLGVSESDSLEDIEKAYKELSKQYHPNMVHHLGKEFQEMAHEKFIEIKWAWDKIQKERESSS